MHALTTDSGSPARLPHPAAPPGVAARPPWDPVPSVGAPSAARNWEGGSVSPGHGEGGFSVPPTRRRGAVFSGIRRRAAAPCGGAGFPPPARCRKVQGDTGAGAAVAVPDAAPDRFPVRRRRIPKPPPRASRNAIRYRITFRIRDRGALYVCSGTRHGTRPGTGSRFAMRNVPMFSVSKLEYSSQLNTKTRDVIRYRITKRFAVRHPRLRRHASTTRN